MMKAFLVPYTNTMCIIDKPCIVPITREIDEGRMLFALQFTKGIKRKEPTFLATLKLNEEAKEVQTPKVVQKVLDEFKDVMATELLKKLPPQRKVDHAIELEPGAKLPTFGHYRMVSPKLEEATERAARCRLYPSFQISIWCAGTISK